MSRLVNVLIIAGAVILGGFISNQIRTYGDETTWKQLDYFPLEVGKLIVVTPFGQEIWVETIGKEIYKLTYPCMEGQVCYQKSSEVPVLANGFYVDEEVHEYIDYNLSEGNCISPDDIYPLPGKVETCITTQAVAESIYVLSVILTDDGELWIWDSPWVSPYTVMENIATSVCVGGFIGFVASSLFLIFLPEIRNAYNKRHDSK